MKTAVRTAATTSASDTVAVSARPRRGRTMTPIEPARFRAPPAAVKIPAAPAAELNVSTL